MIRKLPANGDSRIETGRIGEDMAKRFLEKNGYGFLRRNYSTPFGEIDLVMKRGGLLVFIEVKTRKNENYGPPLSAITPWKKEKMIKSCRYFLMRTGKADAPCRIDAVGIELDEDGNLEILRHVINAVEETDGIWG